MYPARKPLSLLLLLASVALLYWHFSPLSSPDQSVVNIDIHANDGPSSAPSAATMSPLRLAILEADTPQPQTRERYGGYTGVFTALLNAAAQSLSPPQKLEELVSITGYDVVKNLDSYPALDDVDAVLITGSRHTAFESDPWIVNLVDFAKRAIESGRVKTVGVCFGHQIIGRAMGAPLGKSDKGWEVAVTEVDLTDKGKEIFGLDKMVRECQIPILSCHCRCIFLCNHAMPCSQASSASTRCTATSSSTSLLTPSRSAPTTSAPSRACTARGRTSPSRATPSSTPRS